MERLQLPNTNYIVQAMDAPLSPMENDEDEPGLGYQNTLVSIELQLSDYFIISCILCILIASIPFAFRDIRWSVRVYGVYL